MRIERWALAIDTEDERVKVGIVHANAGFAAPPDESGAFRPIELPESQWLRLENGVRSVVRASEIASCSQDAPRY